MSEEALIRIADCKRTRTLKLNLRKCNINGPLPVELAELTWLQELDLEGNPNLISDPPYSNSSEANSDLAQRKPTISYLKNLRRLDLRDTAFEDLGGIRGLTKLWELFLDNVGVSSLEPLKGLVNLGILWLENTRVEDLEPLKNLTSLRTLILSSTFVRNLGALKNLGNLQKLELDKTRVDDLGPLKRLEHLSSLSLRNTPISDLRPLKNLKNLKTLFLTGTDVVSLEPLKGLAQLKTLEYDQGKMKFPPKEILDLGEDAVLDYLRRNEKEEKANLEPQPNWLVKLIIVGNSGTGKSSLIQSWKTGIPQYAAKGTEWLGYIHWRFSPDRTLNLQRPDKVGSTNLRTISGTPTLNIFDFGGQDFYHDAHHLFFSSDTAYIVLWDANKDHIGQEEDAEGILQIHYPLNYWLDAIRYHCQIREAKRINWEVIETAMADPLLEITIDKDALEGLDASEELSQGANSDETGAESEDFAKDVKPIISGIHLPIHALVLQSRIDESPLVFPKMQELKNQFPWIYDFDAVSMNPNNPARLDLSLAKLKELVSRIPLLGSLFSPSWMWVRNALLEEKVDQIVVSIGEFRGLANRLIELEAPRQGVVPSKVKSLFFEEREIESLLKYLSSLGIILHYPEVNALRERVFLKPHIIREQVLLVLKSLRDGEGYLTKLKVENSLKMSIISGLEPGPLLMLMQEFKMAFQIGGLDSDKWIAPLYLPAKAPAGMEMLLEVFDRPIRRIVYPNFIHKSVTLELFQAFSQDLLPESHQGLASERHIVWRDGMVIRLKGSPEMVLVKFFIGAAATANRAAQEAHIEVYAFKTPSGAKPAGKVLEKLREINHYWDTREEVTVDGKTFVPIETLYEAAKTHETNFSHIGKSYPLEAYRSFVPIPWKRIFISYAAQDEGYCTELIKHLSPLNRTKRIAIWEKGQLFAGSERRLAQREEMDRAEIIVLLISADYFHDSEGELMEEYAAALQRALERSATIAYVLIRDCDYESTELKAYRGLLGDGEVIGDVPRNDAMWNKVIGELKKLIADGKGGRFV